MALTITEVIRRLEIRQKGIKENFTFLSTHVDELCSLTKQLAEHIQALEEDRKQ